MTAQQQEELGQLCRQGKLQASKVERFARNPKTALHQAFEWDNTRAGYLFRLQQAEGLIRTRYIILPGPNQEPIRVRAYISLPSERGDGIYRPVQDVLSNGELAQELQESLRRELEGLKRQFAAIAKLSPLYQKVVQALEEIPA